MQPSDFTKETPGKLVKAVEGYWAYVPGELPPQIDLDWDLATSISEADRALSELGGAARNLPNPHLLIGPFISREAVLSSRIEGTQASLSDLFVYEAAGVRRNQESDVGEVANYVKALEQGLKRIEKLPVSLRLMKEMHKTLMSGVRGDESQPGEFRTGQNWIGPHGCRPEDAVYVGPPVLQMKKRLEELENFIHRGTKLPPLVKYAIVHYQFEAIHPFRDGNGRIGRLLITLLLCSERILPQPLLYLSAFFEKHRRDYYRLLLDVSHMGAWKQWIQFFLKGVAEQAKDASDRTRLLLDTWSKYRKKIQTRRASALILGIIDELFYNPAITAPYITKKFSITPRAAQQNIDKLIKARILMESTGRQRNRIFIAPEIMRIVEAPAINTTEKEQLEYLKAQTQSESSRR